MNRKMQPVKSNKNQILKSFLKTRTWWQWTIVCLLLLFSLIVLIYHLVYWQKIYPGVKILNQNVGNQTVFEATNIVKQKLNLQATPSFLNLFAAKQQWQINLEEIDFNYNLERTIKNAYQVGRTKHPVKDFQTKVKIWLKEENLTLDYQLDQNSLDSQIASIASQVFIPAVESTIEINRTEKTPKIVIGSGKDGQELDKRKLLSLINKNLAEVDFSSIELPLIKISPSLTDEEIKNTQQRAEKFLDKKIILVAEENKWELNENDLISFLSFKDGFDQEKIASWSANLALAIDRSPENATFQFSGGRVTEFQAAKEGLKLDQKKTTILVIKHLEQIEKGENPKEIELPLTKTSPTVKTSEVNDLGIKELLGKGISYFQGSIANRIHNIQLATSKLNGILIPSGETFSFNKNLGDVSANTGYKEAYIIKDGHTILGDGGGVCQTSTTLFRAALQAGLPIIERHAHAYRVGYYEQNSQVGLDATVFDPTADLKIKNDTPSYILLQTHIDLQKKMLVYELYGTNDGRKVTLSKSRIWDQISPPPDLYQDDPTLPKGTIKQIDWQAWGAKVAFDYLVERNGEILQKQTFYSNYKAWQSVYLKGTGQ